MKRIQVVIPWPQGLHLRPAADLVRLAGRFRAAIRLSCGERIADARSLMSVLLLCAVAGTALEVEVSGDDEEMAIEAVASVFQQTDTPPSSA